MNDTTISNPITPQTIQLSAVVICQNEAARLAACLESLAFCDEIVVVDGGSRDETVAIARRFTDRVFERPYRGTNDQKEHARRLATGVWVLNLDADETVPPALADEIRVAIRLNRSTGYRIPVKTYLGGHWLRHNGYFPNLQRRLFIRERAVWDRSREPHDRVCLEGRWGKLTTPIEHATADSFGELEAKACRYGAQAAERMAETGRKVSTLDAWFRPRWRFVRSYLFKGGFLDREFGWKLARLQMLEGKIKYSRDSLKSPQRT